MSRAWRRLEPALGPPLLVFALVEPATLLTALGAGTAPLQASTWNHWDAGHYLEIASRGYETFDCGERDLGSPGDTCGNAAWFPGIAWLTAPLYALGLPLGSAMLLLVRMFALGTLVVVWNGLLDRRRDPRGWAALCFAALAPGAVYFHALFPMSMATFGIAGALAAVRHGRWGWAAAAGFVGACAYPTVVLAAPFVAGWVLLDRTVHGGAPAHGERLRRATLAGGGFVAGAATVHLVMRLQTGAWDSFARVQELFAYRHRFPLAAWWDRTTPLFEGATGADGVAAAQAGLVGVLVAGLAVWAVRHRARGLDAMLVLYGLFFWLFPLYVGVQSSYRSDALLLPLAVLIARLPTRVAVAVAAVFGALVWPLTAAYVTHALT